MQINCKSLKEVRNDLFFKMQRDKCSALIEPADMGMRKPSRCSMITRPRRHRFIFDNFLIMRYLS